MKFWVQFIAPIQLSAHESYLAEFLFLLLMLQKSQTTTGWMVLKPCIFTISTGADVWTINSSNQVRSYKMSRWHCPLLKTYSLGSWDFVYRHIVWESPRWLLISFITKINHHQQKPWKSTTLRCPSPFFGGFPPSLQHWKGHEHDHLHNQSCFFCGPLILHFHASMRDSGDGMFHLFQLLLPRSSSPSVLLHLGKK